MTIYARPGFFVDRERSNRHEVVLRDLTMKSTGRYRCEVSTEAPSFATVSNFGDMVVVGKQLRVFFPVLALCIVIPDNLIVLFSAARNWTSDSWGPTGEKFNNVVCFRRFRLVKQSTNLFTTE